MVVNYIENKKTRGHSHLKDPTFDIKHQIMSAEPSLVVKIDQKSKSWLSIFFLLDALTLKFVDRRYYFCGFGLKITYFWILDSQKPFGGCLGTVSEGF